MADRILGAVSVEAIVTKPATADANATDAIHHDIGQILGGKLSWTAGQFLVGTQKWYYSAATTVTISDSDLIGQFGSHTTYTDGAEIDTADDRIRMIYIEHLGIDGAGDPSADTDYLGINIAGSNNTSYYCLMLEPGESIVLKFMDNGGGDAAGQLITTLHGDMFANTAQVKVVALCDDVA